MTDGPGFYELATKFPEAILALLGVETTRPYKAEAVEVKVTGRFDAVLSPAGEVVELAPATPWPVPGVTASSMIPSCGP